MHPSLLTILFVLCISFTLTYQQLPFRPYPPCKPVTYPLIPSDPYTPTAPSKHLIFAFSDLSQLFQSQLLDRLRSLNLHASFVIDVENVKKYAGGVRAIVKEGHWVVVNGHDWDDNTGKRDSEEALERWKRGLQRDVRIFEEKLGKRPVLISVSGENERFGINESVEMMGLWGIGVDSIGNHDRNVLVNDRAVTYVDRSSEVDGMVMTGVERFMGLEQLKCCWQRFECDFVARDELWGRICQQIRAEYYRRVEKDLFLFRSISRPYKGEVTPVIRTTLRIGERSEQDFVQRNRRRVELAYRRLMDSKRSKTPVRDIMYILYTLEDDRIARGDIDDALQGEIDGPGVTRFYLVMVGTVSRLIVAAGLIIFGLWQCKAWRKKEGIKKLT